MDQAKNVTVTFTQLQAITGRISTDVTGQNAGVASANVSLQGTAFSTTTDSNGNFTLTNVPPGNYALIVSAPNFISITQPVNLVGNNLQITVPLLKIYKKGDATGDGKVGLDDAIYILQTVSGMRPE